MYKIPKINNPEAETLVELLNESVVLSDSVKSRIFRLLSASVSNNVDVGNHIEDIENFIDDMKRITIFSGTFLINIRHLLIQSMRTQNLNKK